VVVILSGSPFNARDYGSNADAYELKMNRALALIEHPRVLAVNVPTGPDVKRQFGGFTERSVVGGQTLTPTSFDFGFLAEVLPFVKEELDYHRRLLTSLIQTGALGTRCSTDADVRLLQGLHLVPKGETTGPFMNAAEIRVAFQDHLHAALPYGKLPDRWHERLQSALSAFDTPFAGDVVSDLANAVAGMAHVRSMQPAGKTHLMDRPKVGDTAADTSASNTLQRCIAAGALRA
jgi:hypothetical protein